ncbi:hypothetical protein [Hymenobacter sediminicola]|uniref:Uncharacterized protein n=1 Tax=Hymenobacter sediminicola TaxID=2761579 RepID=A0A7G7W2Z5_9BACT|nr:hypothetical protein [Hymenobacter sediminicola]QNH60738.1 hypothetical protein H4317_11100 [Hymenobacter sediminicola]
MAGRSTSEQPEVIRLRSESLGEERDFSPSHAARLQALEASQGKPDWLPIEPPAAPVAAEPSTDSTPPPADDPRPRKRTAATRKPR